jgi:hypothetical protein
LSPRWERRAAGKEEGPAPVPVPIPVKAAPEAAPEAPRVPTADDASGLEPPFQVYLSFFTILGDPQIIHVTVDYSLPVNVVTNKCLNELGFKPLPQALPPNLSEPAANVLPGLCGWQKLCLHPTAGHGCLSRDIDFVVVGDDYHCDLLIGREFKGVEFKPRLGLYPNYTVPKRTGKLILRVKAPCESFWARTVEPAC